MKVLSWAYVVRNILARKLTSALTIVGMALVIFVFATVLMMSAGLKKTLGSTGSHDNVVIIRAGAQTEIQSTLDFQQAELLMTLPGLATDIQGQPMISRELLVLINIPRNHQAAMANLIVRGTTPRGVSMRPQVKLVQGRMWEQGHSEIIIGSALSRGRGGIKMGDKLHFGQRDWRVVGIFAAEHSGFDSEIWGDEQQMMQAFQRSAFSSVLLRLRESSAYLALAASAHADSRLNVDVAREDNFYAEQSEQLARFINVLGETISIIFALAAVIGAMITMYSSVASRTREIGTLGALGFTRANIVMAFLREALLLGLLSGVLGLIMASLTQCLEIRTTNVQTFAEVVFSLALTPWIVIKVVVFALSMGALGGALPALKAARMNIVDALRAHV